MTRHDERFAWSDYRADVIAMVTGGATARAVAEHLGTTEKLASAEISRLRVRGLLPRAPNTKVRFTDEMDAQLRTSIGAGMSFKDYARGVGLSPDVIRRRAIDLGVVSAHAITLDREVVEQSIKQMRAQGAGFRKIAGQSGASESSVRRIASEMGVPSRLPAAVRQPAPSRRSQFWTNERLDAVARQAEQGKTVLEIASSIGASRNAVIGQMGRLRAKGQIDAAAVDLARRERSGRGRAPRPPAPKVGRLASKPKIVVKIDKPKRAERPAVDRIVGFDAIVASFKAPPTAGVSIVDLDMRSGCRWPFTCDDGETRYCNEAATDGSWCSHHGARVFAGSARPAPKPSFSLRSRGFGEVRP